MFRAPPTTSKEHVMEELTMEIELPRNDEEELVLEWRVTQLERLGVSRLRAEMFANLVDWHEIAALVRGGCAPELAVEIVR
jgi:hypothetical protein